MGVTRQLAGMGLIRIAVTSTRWVNRRGNRGVFRSIEERLWRRWYDSVLRLSRYMSQEFAFQNYGYIYEDRSDEGLRSDESCCAGLYENLVRGAGLQGLQGKTVLDVGCGKGGGCVYVMRAYRPLRKTGLDISGEAIRYCRFYHGDLAGLDFVRGESTALPFPAASFEIVTNVESSNHYADCPLFFSEVRRVLKPGGLFLFTDWRPADKMPLLEDQLARSFEVVSKRDITGEVVRALDVDSERRQRLVKESEVLRQYGRLVQTVLINFAGAKGSKRYDGFSSRRLLYIAAWLRKPD